MIFNICEALKNRDKQNDCKYDFLTTYQCNKYSNNTKKELIESLNNNCSDKKLEFILSRTANTEKIDLSEKFLEQFDSLNEEDSKPLNIHYYALVNTVKENGISKPTILNVCTASSIDKALMFLDPVDSEHVIEISEQKYDDYFKGQDILDEGAIWDAVKNGVKGVADAVKNINAERKNTDSYRIKQEIKDKKKDLRVAKEMEKAAKDSAKYGYHSSDSSNQSNNSAYSNSTSNDTNNNSNSTSFKAGSNPTFNRSRTSSNPSREEVLSPELIQQLIDSGDEATLQNIKIQAEKARQEAKKNNDKLEAEEKARKKQEEEKARKAAEAQSSNTNQNEEFTKMGGNLTESESLKESLNLNEAKNIINVLNKNLRVRFKHSAGGIFSLDRTPFNEDTFNKLIKNNYKMIGDILEEQGLKYDISEDVYISNDRNLYVTIYGDTGTVIVQFDEMESESLNESNNAVYDMYKNQYKNLLQDIKYVLNSDNIEDIRAYDKESQGEYILSKLFDSRMNKQNMSFEDAKEDVIDFLYRTRADAKSELELRNKRSLESKSIMNKVKSELSKDYKLVSESEDTLYFKAPSNSTHDDCIAFVDKVVAVSGGKYTSTGRGGSWTLWDILTPGGSYIKAGYDYSNKDNYAVYFKSILTESRSTRSTSKESVKDTLKESVNSDIVSMIKKQFPKATVKISARKHSDVHKSNPDTPVGKTKYVDIRITPDSASSVNSILQYCNHNIKKVLSSDERFDYYGDVPARNPRGSKEVVLSYQDYSGLSDDEYKSLLGESINPADLTDCPACGDVSFDSKRGRCTKCNYREESLNEDTQLKFDDDMINDIEVLYMWRPEEVERILIKHGSDKNNDNWIDGLDLPAAYDEIMSTFRDEYSDYDEIDYDVAKVLGLVEESFKESIVFSKETPQGKVEVSRHKDGTYRVLVNGEEHGWFDHDDLTSLKYYLKYKKDISDEDLSKATLFKESTQIKSHHICQEGKDSVSKDDHDDIIFRLRKLSTEASEALHKYENLDNLEECRDILYYLVNDSRRLLDFVNDLLVSRKSESMQLPRIGDKKKALSSNINQNEEFTNMNDIFKALNEADYCIKLTEDLSQEEIHTSGISAYITDAINGEYDTINDYNEMLLALKDDSQDSAISVIEDIIKEEYTHIGQLQELLKMYASPSSEIKSGEVEAQKQIEETKDDQSDSEFDNEFGLNSGFDSFI